MEWSWTTWLVSVAAVLVSGAVAWAEDNWIRRPGLAMGFVNHGGMWSDLVLLSMANAGVVPYLTWGPWLLGALLVSGLGSVWVHSHWYRAPSGPVLSNGDEIGASDVPHAAALPPSNAELGDAVESGRSRDGDHVWPARVRGTWWRDLSWSGWAHVIYVAGELTLLIGFLVHVMPSEVVMFVAAIFTIHVPIGLLQPRWYKTGHIATVSEQPLLAPLLLALWTITMVKL